MNVFYSKGMIAAFLACGLFVTTAHAESQQFQFQSAVHKQAPDQSQLIEAGKVTIGWNNRYIEDRITTLTPRNSYAEVTSRSYQWNDNLRKFWVNSNSDPVTWFVLEQKPASADNEQPLTLSVTMESGTTATPDIMVSGSGSFGNVETGTSSTHTITIINNGDANLVINSVGGLAAPFIISSNGCTGATVAPSGSCGVSVRFKPTSSGSHSDALVITSNDPDEASVSFGVSGIGTVAPAPDISVSGNGSFGDVEVNTSSTHTITISNIGDANLLIGNLFGLATPFSIVSNSCSGANLAPNSSCTFGVYFAPTTTGTRSDTLVIPSNDPDEGSFLIGVYGTGVAAPGPNIAVSGSGSFGEIEVGTNSIRTITLSNTGNAELTINSIGGLATPFLIVSNNCGATLAANASCTLDVQFEPSSAVSYADTLIISSSDPDQASVNVSVNGNGTTALEPNIVVTGSGSFGDVEVGTSSIHTITISNTGNAELTINSIGGLATPFLIVSNNCSTTLAENASCTMGVQFEPSSAVSYADTMIISSSDPDQPTANVGVTGSGTTSPEPNIVVTGSSSFGDVEFDSESTLSFSIRNTGDASLIVDNLFGLAAPFSRVLDTCSSKTLAPNGSCTINVLFAPTEVSNYTDTLVIPSNDPDQANFLISVNGTGTNPSTSPDITVSGAGFFGDVESGDSITHNINVSNAGDANLEIDSLYGLTPPFSIVTDSCSDKILAPNGSCSVSVRFAPTEAGEYTDTLVIPSNDPAQSNFSLDVSGSSVEDPSPGEQVGIISTGFENGTAEDWTLDGGIDVNDTQSIGQYSLRHRKSATSELKFSTAGYINVNVTMHLAATSLELEDGCYAEVSTNGGTSWTSVVEVHDGSDDGTFFSATVSPPDADNNPNLKLRFRSTGQHKSDFCWGDDVIVLGTPIADNTDSFTVYNLGAPYDDVLIVDDGFEDNDGDGYSDTGNWVLNGSIVDGTLAIEQFSLRHEIDTTSELSVSTAGYIGVSVQMHLAASALDKNGGCYAEVSTNGGDSWTTVVEVLKGNDDGSFISNTLSPVGIDDNVDLQLRFRAASIGNGGYCYGDDIIVSGTPNGGN